MAQRSSTGGTGQAASDGLALARAAGGAVHRRGRQPLRQPAAYEAIVPPRLQAKPGCVVQLSGVAEIAGGVGVLLPCTRRLSGVGLVALLRRCSRRTCTWRRNPERFQRIPRWALYARLPLQPLMMLWAWRATRR